MTDDPSPGNDTPVHRRTRRWPPPTTWTGADGRTFRIRPISPHDEAAMVAFHAELTDVTVYARYFELYGLAERTAHERLVRVCADDDAHEIVLIAEPVDADGTARIAAVGRLSLADTEPSAEFALLVGDEWQRRGLGSELLRRLVAIGRDEGLRRIWAEMLPTNVGMRHTARDAGFSVTETFGSSTVRAELLLEV